jgi:hypothetical protein
MQARAPRGWRAYWNTGCIFCGSIRMGPNVVIKVGAKSIKLTNATTALRADSP